MAGLSRAFLFLALAAAGGACASKPKRPPNAPKGHYLSYRSELKGGVVEAQPEDLRELTPLAGGGLFTFSPREVMNIRGFPALTEYGGDAGDEMSAHLVAEGIDGVLDAPEGKRRSLTVRRYLRYAGVETALKDYPFLGDRLQPEESGEVEILVAEIRVHLVRSTNGRAFRVIVDHFYWLEAGGKPKGKPVLALLVYSHPTRDGAGDTKAVIFDYAVVPVNGEFTGGRQASGWLPLQEDSADGPFDIKIGVVEVTREQANAWLDTALKILPKIKF